MNITLGFRLDKPEFTIDPSTGEVKQRSIENLPAEVAADRIDEALSVRIQFSDDEKQDALDTIKAVQAKYPHFGALKEVSNSFGNLLIASKGRKDNSVAAAAALKL